MNKLCAAAIIRAGRRSLDIGEDTDGDLLLYNKNDRRQLIDRIAFRPNRVVAADGSIPHAARAPSDDRFRMSVIVRGVYTCRRSNP
ncbi:MAG: hypothetical protein DMF92_22520 [Acidobacteria bacterium]|nr:MAG: hypothetical protein DMF92_22520 [Acidobacteriota bacterium]